MVKVFRQRATLAFELMRDKAETGKGGNHGICCIFYLFSLLFSDNTDDKIVLCPYKYQIKKADRLHLYQQKRIGHSIAVSLQIPRLKPSLKRLKFPARQIFFAQPILTQSDCHVRLQRTGTLNQHISKTQKLANRFSTFNIAVLSY